MGSPKTCQKRCQLRTERIEIRLLTMSSSQLDLGPKEGNLKTVFLSGGPSMLHYRFIGENEWRFMIAALAILEPCRILYALQSKGELREQSNEGWFPFDFVCQGFCTSIQASMPFPFLDRNGSARYYFRSKVFIGQGTLRKGKGPTIIPVAHQNFP